MSFALPWKPDEAFGDMLVDANGDVIAEMTYDTIEQQQEAAKFVSRAVNHFNPMWTLLIKAESEMRIIRDTLTKPGRTLTPSSLSLYDKLLNDIQREIQALRREELHVDSETTQAT